jgi:hypothetical protein
MMDNATKVGHFNMHTVLPSDNVRFRDSVFENMVLGRIFKLKLRINRRRMGENYLI